MNQTGKTNDNPFFLIVGTMYCFAITWSVLHSTVLKVSPVWIFAVCFVLMLAATVISHNKYTLIGFLGLLLLAALFIFIIIFFFELPDWLVSLGGLLNDIILFITGNLSYNPLFNAPFLFITALLTVIMTTLNIKVRFGFFILSLFGGVIILMPYIFNFTSVPLPGMIFSACFLVFLLKYLRSRSYGTVRFPLGFIPITAAFFIFCAALPQPTFHDHYGIIAKVNGIFAQRTPPQRASGFTNAEGRLGGAFTSRNIHVLDVYSDEPLYLMGAIMDSYTGYSWTKSASLNGELYQKLSGDNNIFSLTAPKKPPIKEARIVNARDSRFVFVPQNAESIEFNTNVTLYQSIFGELATERAMRGNTFYTVKYTPVSKPINIDDSVRLLFSDNAVNIASVNTAVPTDDMLQISIQTEQAPNTNNTPPLTREETQNYLALPDSFPESVKALALNITENAPSAYAKMILLEDFLRHFEYTLTPSQTPEDVDFVEHFLFSEKRGYCTYFASALAVMGRATGIPTRYIEGYITPKEPDAPGVYRVDTSYAHAWVEAFINNEWIIFEPTPGFFTVPDTTYESVRNTYAPTEPVERTDYIQQFFDEPPPDNSSTRETVSVSGPESSQLNFYLRYVLLTACFAAFLGAVFGVLVLSRYLRFRHIENSPVNIRALTYFKYILKATNLYGLELEDSETILAYAKRCGQRFAFCNHQIFLEDLARIFNAAAYGKNDITGEQLTLMRDCYIEMDGRLKRFKLYKPQYLLYKYVLNKI